MTDLHNVRWLSLADHAYREATAAAADRGLPTAEARRHGLSAVVDAVRGLLGDQEVDGGSVVPDTRTDPPTPASGDAGPAWAPGWPDEHMLEAAMGLLANAVAFDPATGWDEARRRWMDAYHRQLSASVPAGSGGSVDGDAPLPAEVTEATRLAGRETYERWMQLDYRDLCTDLWMEVAAREGAKRAGPYLAAAALRQAAIRIEQESALALGDARGSDGYLFGVGSAIGWVARFADEVLRGVSSCSGTGTPTEGQDHGA